MTAIVLAFNPTVPPAVDGRSDSGRPFRTYYFHEKTTTNSTEYTRIGRAGSEVGAIRAAVVHLLTGRYGAADVYDLDGVRLFRIRKTANTLSVNGYFKPLEL